MGVGDTEGRLAGGIMRVRPGKPLQSIKTRPHHPPRVRSFSCASLRIPFT